MTVVLDTNVWVSALEFGQSYGVPVRALEKAMREDIIATCDQIDAEILRILTRKFAWEEQTATRTLTSVLARSVRCMLKGSVHVCRDPCDDMFLECAARTNADLLVAGDKDLLVLGSYGKTRIVTPAEYIQLGM